MATKSAACDPCAARKIACGHEKPVCARCLRGGQAARCTYRENPFKRQRRSKSGCHDQNAAASLTDLGKPTRDYPNPGYLGNSSHATIYEHLSPSVRSANADSLNMGGNRTPAGRSKRMFNDAHILNGAQLLEQIRSSKNVSHYGRLVHMWLAGGRNVALATPFTRPCADRVLELFRNTSKSAELLSRELFQQSSAPLNYDTSTTSEEFCENFCGSHARWETLGLFFTALSRAVTEMAHFLPLYDSWAERRRLQHVALHFADQCLEISLSLDCLNDIQLILQYEDFIAHACINGDQSYQSWRKLGDVVSSLFALGYHERLGDMNECPGFLRETRRAAFARAYSADKNVSIFLGRPPRMHRRYCKHRLLEYFDSDSWDPGQSDTPTSMERTEAGGINYQIETWWSAKCAALKERILDLSAEENAEERLSLANQIQHDCKAQWFTLPVQFQLETALKSCKRKPIELDFLVSARLNHLHVIFLLRLALLQQPTNLDDCLTNIAAEMLGVAVESLILRDQLLNSGTGLVWRVAYYGLPAAGIICLALLNRLSGVCSNDIDVPAVVQDLCVLVAQVETGALVHFEDPNYALLATATRTIKNLLDKFLSGKVQCPPVREERPVSSVQPPAVTDNFTWEPWTAEQDVPDFESDFWANLAEHPALLAPDGDASRMLWQ